MFRFGLWFVSTIEVVLVAALNSLSEIQHRDSPGYKASPMLLAGIIKCEVLLHTYV